MLGLAHFDAGVGAARRLAFPAHVKLHDEVAVLFLRVEVVPLLGRVVLADQHAILDAPKPLARLGLEVGQVLPVEQRFHLRLARVLVGRETDGRDHEKT